jgi:hypothetical protein
MFGGLFDEIALASKAGITAARVFRNTYRDRLRRSMSERSKNETVFTGDFPVDGRYLISTDKGLFRLERGLVQKISEMNGFGLALAGDHIYLAADGDLGKVSTIVVGDRRALSMPGSSLKWRSLYSAPTMDAGERIHQICVYGDALWLAHTAHNTYMKIDRHTGRWLAEICPFRCEFGLRIKRDHNHVNSISAYPSFLLVGAWRINNRGCFAVAGEGLLRFYAYSNPGIHDCHITGDEFLFSDSFGFDRAPKAGDKGRLVCNGHAVDDAYFLHEAPGCVRGIAGGGGEMIVGLSFPGGRADRHLGSGGLLLLRDRKVTHRISLPCAQVYDVLREDGQSFDLPPSVKTFQEASALLERSLGPAILEVPLSDMLLPQNLNLSLNGTAESSLDEYLNPSNLNS